MKTALLIIGIVVLALIGASDGLTCKQTPETCKEGTCCVEFGMFGICRPLLKEGEKCELKPIKSKLLYLMKCPCGEGLTCEEDGSGSLIRGECVQK